MTAGFPPVDKCSNVNHHPIPGRLPNQFQILDDNRPTKPPNLDGHTPSLQRRILAISYFHFLHGTDGMSTLIWGIRIKQKLIGIQKKMVPIIFLILHLAHSLSYHCKGCKGVTQLTT